MADSNAINPGVVASLIDRYKLDGPQNVRYFDDPDYYDDAIECYGRVPNSTETGWFFVGYETDMER